MQIKTRITTNAYCTPTTRDCHVYNTVKNGTTVLLLVVPFILLLNITRNRCLCNGVTHV